VAQQLIGHLAVDLDAGGRCASLDLIQIELQRGLRVGLLGEHVGCGDGGPDRSRPRSLARLTIPGKDERSESNASY